MTEQHKKNHFVSYEKAAEFLGISIGAAARICAFTHGPTECHENGGFTSFALEIFKKRAVVDGVFYIPEQPIKQGKSTGLYDKALEDGLKIEYYDNDAGWTPLENPQFGLPARYYRIPRQPIPAAWLD